MKYLQPGAYVPPPPPDIDSLFEDIGPHENGIGRPAGGSVVWAAAALLALSFAAGLIFWGWL